MKMSCRQLNQMRLDGATYQEIANANGVSRQCIHQKLTSYNEKLKGMRGHGYDINTIIFKGFYEYFKNNLNESISAFCKKVFGYGGTKYTQQLRRLLSGENNSRYSIPHIKKMCEVTGMTFEELFERRA